ncbi:MAG: glycosyltransferase family 4 protein [Flavobacteriales bacterium]
MEQVIHVCMGKANPDRMNGVNKVVHHLAEEQAALGLQVRIWGITRTPSAAVKERAVITELFQDHGLIRLSPRIIAAVQALEGTRTLFHVHGGFIPQLALFARTLERSGLPYVYTPHGAHNLVALQRSKWKKRLYMRLLERRLVRRAFKVHFIGASEVEGSRRMFGPCDHVLIPNGQAMLVAGADVHIDKARVPVFGTVGRLDLHTKGLDLLLQGFARFIAEGHGRGELWLVGDGPDRAKVMELSHDLGIADRVKFRGALFGAEKDRTMAAMDLFCLTSRNEGLPGVVLEAASLGVPCMVSPETNMAEHIAAHDAGIALQANTPDHIANGLRAAFNAWIHSDLSEQGENARRMVRIDFDWRAIAQRHLDAYAHA